MHISYEWREDGINAAQEERVTLADLRIALSGQNVCLHLDKNTCFDQITVPLYSIAEGIIRDWWQIFGGRDREFSLVKYRMGYAIPDIRMQFDGAAFEVCAIQKTYRNPDVRYWGGASAVLSRESAECILSDFIHDVLDRLQDNHLRTNAQLRWARVLNSRSDAEEQVFCEAAGALDLDPYAIDDVSVELIEASAKQFTGEALLEFLGGLRERQSSAPDVIKWLLDAEKRQRYQAKLPHLRDLAEKINRNRDPREEHAWALGYRKARAARNQLEMKPGAENASFEKLAAVLGAKHFALARNVDGLVALRENRDDGVYIHLRRQGTSASAVTGHNFAFARAVGDAICFAAEHRAVINELRYAFRQAASRAFAAEFLAPVEAVMSLRNKGRDVTSIANQFVVSSTVIERQIENATRIRDVCD